MERCTNIIDWFKQFDDIEAFFAYMRTHPQYAYLVIAGICAFMLLGVILGRKRTYDPRGSSSSVKQRNRLGEKGYRNFVGICYALGMIGALVARYYTK